MTTSSATLSTAQDIAIAILISLGSLLCLIGLFTYHTRWGSRAGIAGGVILIIGLIVLGASKTEGHHASSTLVRLS